MHDAGGLVAERPDVVAGRLAIAEALGVVQVEPEGGGPVATTKRRREPGAGVVEGRSALRAADSPRWSAAVAIGLLARAVDLDAGPLDGADLGAARAPASARAIAVYAGGTRRIGQACFKAGGGTTLTATLRIEVESSPAATEKVKSRVDRLDPAAEDAPLDGPEGLGDDSRRRRTGRSPTPTRRNGLPLADGDGQANGSPRATFLGVSASSRLRCVCCGHRSNRRAGTVSAARSCSGRARPATKSEADQINAAEAASQRTNATARRSTTSRKSIDRVSSSVCRIVASRNGGRAESVVVGRRSGGTARCWPAGRSGRASAPRSAGRCRGRGSGRPRGAITWRRPSQTPEADQARSARARRTGRVEVDQPVGQAGDDRRSARRGRRPSSARAGPGGGGPAPGAWRSAIRMTGIHVGLPPGHRPGTRPIGPHRSV